PGSIGPVFASPMVVGPSPGIFVTRSGRFLQPVAATTTTNTTADKRTRDVAFICVSFFRSFVTLPSQVANCSPKFGQESLPVSSARQAKTKFSDDRDRDRK